MLWWQRQRKKKVTAALLAYTDAQSHSSQIYTKRDAPGQEELLAVLTWLRRA
jgi:hypothetical protein